MRPAVSAGRRFLALAAVLAVIAGAGVVAFVYQVVNGLAVTGKNDGVFWGLYTTSLVTFIGFSYGGALVSAILRLTNASWRGPVSRIAEGTALATLLVGALFPIIHLGRPDRFWELFVQPQVNSPIFWDMVAILTYLVATIILLGLPLIPDFAAVRDTPGLRRWRRVLYRIGSFGWLGVGGQRRALDRAMTAVAILIIPLAVTVHTVLSYAFSLTSRPGWHSSIFGPYFVIGAIYSGVAVVILAAVAYRRAYHLERWIDERSIRNLAFLMVALGVAYGYATFTEITTEGYVSEQADAAVLYTLMLARYAPLFWGFVGLGLVAPIALVAIPRTRTIAGIALAALLVVGSMYVKRFLIIVPPLTRPLVGGEPATYIPTWVELTIVAGAAAGIVLILIILFRIVPVLSIHEIEEIAAERAARESTVVEPRPVGASVPEATR